MQATCATGRRLERGLADGTLTEFISVSRDAATARGSPYVRIVCQILWTELLSVAREPWFWITFSDPEPAFGRRRQLLRHASSGERLATDQLVQALHASVLDISRMNTTEGAAAWDRFAGRRHARHRTRTGPGTTAGAVPARTHVRGPPAGRS
ncbi:hypothetical protein GCM10010495_73080 [Kitasatospora herbaricolor]|nr:hypothetical protein GCM10010495_73080 [Kitasatospora herbaricolor]